MAEAAPHHGMVWPGERLQAENVCAGAVEDDEDLGSGPNCSRNFFTTVWCRVGAIADHVPFIGECDRLDDFGMNAGLLSLAKLRRGFMA